MLVGVRHLSGIFAHLPLDRTRLLGVAAIGAVTSAAVGTGLQAWKRDDADAPCPDWLPDALLHAGAAAAVTGAALVVAGKARGLIQDARVRGVGDLRIAGAPYTEVLEKSAARFRIVAGDAPASREVVAETAAAAEMLGGKHGPRARSALVTMLESPTSSYGRPIARRVSLSVDAMGQAANEGADLLALYTPRSRRDWFRVARVVRSAYERADEVGGWYQHAGGGSITLGPMASAALMRKPLAEGGTYIGANETARGLEVVAHELRHAVTPNFGPGDLEWVEEGGASILGSRWAAHLGGRLGVGIPFDHLAKVRTTVSDQYLDWAGSLRELSRLGGDDVATKQGMRAFEQLWQSTNGEGYLKAIAGKIAAAHDRPLEPVLDLVTRVEGRPERIAPLMRYLGVTG